MTEAVAFATIDISPKTFAALSEHGRSELCRLLLERGYNLKSISDFCGLVRADVHRLASERFAFVLGDKADAPVEIPEGNLNVKQKDAVIEALSFNHCRLLVRFPNAEPVYWKDQHSMEVDVGLKFGHGPKAIESLYDSNLVERAPPRRGYEHGWMLTERGVEMRASINPDDLVLIRRPK